MTTGWSGLGGGKRLLLRLGVLALGLAVLGLPINNLFKYVLLAALTLALFAGAVRTDLVRWLGAIAVGVAVVAAHVLWPAPRIDEGFNVFLPGPDVERTLPADVVRALTTQFNAQYPPEKRCNDPARGCWRPDPSPTGGYSFSADGIYDRPAMSRRVLDIGFSDPVDLRIGEINEIIYNWPDNASDIKRFERDRKSLNLFDRYRVTFPLFVAWRFPADFAGSNLCWRGTLLWPSGERHEAITQPEMACRTLRAEDAGKTIVAASIQPSPKLSVSLRSTLKIQLGRAFELGLTLLGVCAIGLLLIRVERRRLVLPLTLIALTVILTVIIDWQFIGGYRPLDAGDDGYTHEGFSRYIIRHLLAGDLAAALRGEEAIYYFAPALRYWHAFGHFLFGDTFLGYFTLTLVLPFLVLALAKRFLPSRWALAFTLIFVAIPVGTAFGSSLVDYVVWASRGFADPLGFVLLFAGIYFVVPRITGAADTGRAFAGALLLAMATFCRPNFLLASGTMILAGVIMALAWRHVARAAVLLLGFATLAVSPLHNYVFGNSLVPFTNNVGHVDILLMSPLDYFKAASELARLDFAGPHVGRAVVQIMSWLSGAHHVMATIPLHLAGVLILAWVALLGRRYDPWLRIVALATLLQHGIGVCYLNNARYNLGTWLLTTLVVTAWLVAMIERMAPAARARLAQVAGVRQVRAWLARLERTGAAA